VNLRASLRLTAAVALVAALAVPAGALGAGGTTIASAPTIAPGATITANSATDQTAVGDDGVGFESGCWDAVEYWKVPLTAGDAVTVSVTIGVPTYNLEIGVFPAGTTDRTLANAQSVKTGLPTDKVPLTFTAPATGNYALAAGPNCYNGEGGPFTFVVSVTHHAVAKTSVALPALTHIAVSGTITAKVTAGGSPVTSSGTMLKLDGAWGGATHVLAVAAPKNGSARFAYHLPAGAKGKIVLRVTGAATSAPVTVTVS
jgi:hypothetical protein